MGEYGFATAADAQPTRRDAGVEQRLGEQLTRRDVDVAALTDRSGELLKVIEGLPTRDLAAVAAQDAALG